MRLVWRRRALADLAEAYDWLAERSPRAARTNEERIRRAAESLIDLPDLGSLLSDDVTRRLAVRRTSYLIYYRVVGAEIVIDAVLHKRRNRPT